MKIILRFIVVGLILTAFTGSMLSARAQTSTQQAPPTLQVQGLAISPFLIEVQTEPGKEIRRSITLTNTTALPLPIEISINDFVPDAKTGQAKFLDSSQTSDPKFSLSAWVSIIKQPSFIIPPRASTSVEFAIQPPQDVEPGTHYGGILFAQQPKAVKGTNTEVTQKAGAIILVSLGKAEEHGAITNFFADVASDGRSVDLFLTFHNFGNVHSKPKGEIYIDNLFGHQVGNLYINRDAGIVLPESEHTFTQRWNSGARMGRYTARVLLYYGNPKLEVRQTIHFWILPVKSILLILLLLTALTALLWKGIKIYNAHILKKAGMGSHSQ